MTALTTARRHGLVPVQTINTSRATPARESRDAFLQRVGITAGQAASTVLEVLTLAREVYLLEQHLAGASPTAPTLCGTPSPMPFYKGMRQDLCRGYHDRYGVVLTAKDGHRLFDIGLAHIRRHRLWTQ